MQPIAEEHPAHVRPEAAFTRRVRIAVLVGVLMMDAVRRDPEDRPAFERERPAQRQEVLDRFRGLEPAVGQQPVIADADAEADHDPVDDDERQQP